MMMLQRTTTVRTYRVGHLFCGIGAGAKGFNDARPRIGHVAARFECAGGIDVDPGAIRNFERITGTPGTVLDLFDAEQYAAFHGRAPAPGWRPAGPDDIIRAFGRHLDVAFLSAPCKGFSGLLSQRASGTDKYQALNRLTLRGVWLMLEAYKDDPIPIILFENVPRIATRGRQLIDRIQALLRSYGYVFAETTHDCGEIGGLAQSRKRFLLVARHVAKVPPFLYQPAKSQLRGVGEVIGRLPLPGTPEAGPMHAVPRLQWQTWVRLAFVPAGRDWRALNDLAIVDGHLRDYGIAPDRQLRDNQLGVLDWHDTAPTLTGQRSPAQGRFSVADPRMEGVHNETLGIRRWDEPAGVVAGASRPANGAHSVADPRPQQANQSFAQYGVKPWTDTAGTVTAQAAPGGGPNSVADPRLDRVAHSNVYRIVGFGDHARAVTSSREMAVADPRPPQTDYTVTKYQVTPYDGSSRTVIGASTAGDGAFAVADPRGGIDLSALHGKHRVEQWDGASRAVIAGRDNGACAVADPRPTHGPQAHTNKLKVCRIDAAAPTVTGSDRVGSGALSVADPRPVGLMAEARTAHGYDSQAHYGVLGWADTSNAVPGYAKYDRGKWSVADPREAIVPPIATLPAAKDRLVARIVALDGTWHRPFTTLELAALQSLFDPGEVFDLEGGSDQLKREWIGNAVPSAAARGMAETIGETLLLADLGETFTLSSRAIWTKPLALALAVDPTQATDRMDVA